MPYMVKASAGRSCTAQFEKALIAAPIGGQMKLSSDAGRDHRKRGNNGHGTFTGKKAEITRELDSIEPVESRRGDEADNDAAEDSGLDRLNPHDRRRLDAAEFRANAHRGEEDNKADCAGESGDAVVIGQANGNADGEEQWQIGKDRAARCRHDLRHDRWQPREVGAADAEQDAGDRQHRHRQHHALADFLQKREGVCERRHLHITTR